MRTYIISLAEKSTSKGLETPKSVLELQSQFDDLVWIHGVNGKELSKEEIEKNCNKLFARFGPRSAIGIAMAHVKAWESVVDSGDQFALIVEDDVVLEPNFKIRLQNAIDKMPSDTDILAVGCSGCTSAFNPIAITTILLGQVNPFKFTEVNDMIVKPSTSLATHAYIITQQGSHKLLSLIKGSITNHVDAQIQSLFQSDKINYYALKDLLAFQTSTSSEYLSTNSVPEYPQLISKLLKKWEVEKLYTADYTWSFKIARIGSATLSGGALFFAVLSFFLTLTGLLKPWMIFVGLTLISIPDMINPPDARQHIALFVAVTILASYTGYFSHSFLGIFFKQFTVAQRRFYKLIR